MRRMLLILASFTALFASARTVDSAQDVAAAVVQGTLNVYTEILAFSADGRLLREIGEGSLKQEPPEEFGRVRAITYVAATGRIRRLLNLEPDTYVLSATSDARIAVISIGRDQQPGHPRVFLLDMETGQKQDVPPSWFERKESNPIAQISGDGRLISAYSEVNDGMVVALYNWRTKKLVARQSTGFPAGGFAWGGVTQDGKIAFCNNRSGSDIVDPTTGKLIATMKPESVRSPDGAWIVDFPYFGYADDTTEVFIKNGMTGRVSGKLDLQLKPTQEVTSWPWRGAFCGVTGKFVAATPVGFRAYEIPSGKQIASFPLEKGQSESSDDTQIAAVACSSNGKRVAIRLGDRLTLRDLK